MQQKNLFLKSSLLICIRYFIWFRPYLGDTVFSNFDIDEFQLVTILLVMQLVDFHCDRRDKIYEVNRNLIIFKFLNEDTRRYKVLRLWWLTMQTDPTLQILKMCN